MDPFREFFGTVSGPDGGSVWGPFWVRFRVRNGFKTLDVLHFLSFSGFGIWGFPKGSKGDPPNEPVGFPQGGPKRAPNGPKTNPEGGLQIGPKKGPRDEFRNGTETALKR